MEGTPGSCLGGKIINQFRQVWMIELRGRGKVKQLGKCLLWGMNNSTDNRFFIPVCDRAIDMPRRVHIRKQSHCPKGIPTSQAARGIQAHSFIAEAVKIW